MTNELYHYNHNHDPRTGKFTTSIGGAVKYTRSINKAEKARRSMKADVMRSDTFAGPNSDRAKQFRVKQKYWENETKRLIREAQQKGYTVTDKDVIRSGQAGISVGVTAVGGVPIYAIYKVTEHVIYGDSNKTEYKGRTIRQNPTRIKSKKYKVKR